MSIDFHIGAHRTGSSAIQSFCVRNREELAARGVHYPEAPTDKVAMKGETTAGNANPLYRHIAGERDFPKFWNAHLEALKSGRRLLYSAEVFWGKGMSVLPEITRGAETRIIVYLRPQTDMLVSAYARHVRLKEYPGTLDDLFDKIRAQLHFEPRLKALESMYAQIAVRPYDKRAFRDNLLMSDLLDQLGLAYDGAFTGAETVVNRYETDAQMSADLRQRMIAEYDEENRRICERYFDGAPWLLPWSEENAQLSA